MDALRTYKGMFSLNFIERALRFLLALIKLTSSFVLICGREVPPLRVSTALPSGKAYYFPLFLLL